MADDRTTPKPAGPKPPTERPDSPPPQARSAPAAIADFLAAARASDPNLPRGRLVFALDATMSRQPTWDRAARLQAEMFEEAARIGGLEVQLVYFRGFDECRASRFVPDARALGDLMTRIDCRAGRTQIGRVLRHVLATAREKPVAALVYVGDALEEPIDELAAVAGEIALHGTKAFLFQEGRDPAVARGFAEIARLTAGAHLHLGSGSADDLGALLRAVAAYAAGGLTALEALGTRDGAAAALLSHIR